jgi:AcrR family transcriptional regulator
VSSTVFGMASEKRTFQAGPLRIRVSTSGGSSRSVPKERLTVDRIVDAALEIMNTEGYDAVTMRSVARKLDTGPASLYAHVANRVELDQLVVNRIAASIGVPEPDPERWEELVRDMGRATLAAYRAHPGSARASLGLVPTEQGALLQAEGLMAVLIAGGIAPQLAAWFGDLIALYTGALAFEEAIWIDRARSGDGPQSEDDAVSAIREVFEALPVDRFPILTSMAGVMVNGGGEERFEFGLDVLIAGLKAINERGAGR